jgi:2'-5' RNA ligase
MQGIVALLDEKHTVAVRELWSGLEKQGGQTFPHPHVSLAILDEDNLDLVLERLEQLVRGLRPFVIHTAGVGIFNKPAPVVYLPVVRAPNLESLHQLVWRTYPRMAKAAQFYHADQWVPHITLAAGDLNTARLPEVIAFLADRDLHWEISIDNLAFAVEVAGGFELRCGCKFGGS